MKAVTEGASREVCEALGIPPHWAEACEDSAHFGHDGCVSSLHERLEQLRAADQEDVLTFLTNEVLQIADHLHSFARLHGTAENDVPPPRQGLANRVKGLSAH